MSPRGVPGRYEANLGKKELCADPLWSRGVYTVLLVSQSARSECAADERKEAEAAMRSSRGVTQSETQKSHGQT